MEISTENDITPEAAKWLRDLAGLNQADFWRSVASNPASGCRYEQGDEIPRPLKRLIFATYVADLPTDASDKERAEQAISAGRALQLHNIGGVQRVSAIIAETAEHLKRAIGALGI